MRWFVFRMYLIKKKAVLIDIERQNSHISKTLHSIEEEESFLYVQNFIYYNAKVTELHLYNDQQLLIFRVLEILVYAPLRACSINSPAVIKIVNNFRI